MSEDKKLNEINNSPQSQNRDDYAVDSLSDNISSAQEASLANLDNLDNTVASEAEAQSPEETDESLATNEPDAEVVSDEPEPESESESEPEPEKADNLGDDSKLAPEIAEFMQRFFAQSSEQTGDTPPQTSADLAEELARQSVVLLPLSGVLAIPNFVMPLAISRPQDVAACRYAIDNKRLIFAVAQKDADNPNPGRRDLYTVGTVCAILKDLHMPDGSLRIVVHGVARARIGRVVSNRPVTLCSVKPLQEVFPQTAAQKNALKALSKRIREWGELGAQLPPEILMVMDNLKNPSHIVDIASFHLNLTFEQRQELLAMGNINQRLNKVLQYLSREIEVQKIENKVQRKAEQEMAKGNRDYFLRQQMKAIQEELGDEVDETQEADQLAEEIRQAGMPEYAETHALKELKKMRRMPPYAQDRSVLQNYLDWLLQFPWAKLSEDKLNIARAAKILDEDHYGLKEVKERILEFLAVRRLKNDSRGPIMCLVGPPGVGKTSLGRSIARSLGRQFNRTSLGGIRDEAEIRGHRRTYVGAMPGRIIQAMCTAQSRNPVIMLDEIDKVGNDFRGDPSAALLEALDPEQNNEFKDHYMQIPVDLSSAMFIMTANVMDTIPPALRDRMEVIRIPGYTAEEKLQIAMHFLVPRQREQHGLSEKQLQISEAAMHCLIREYTREAGVRNLEREIAHLCRKRARFIVEQKKMRQALPVIEPAEVYELLGVPRYSPEPKIDEHPCPGSVQGLSWTQVGGEMLTIETAVMPGRGRVMLTGNLGQVMKESARLAISWGRRWLAEQGCQFAYYKNDVHIHVPEGAIPKDGPSAGITMASSYISAVLGRPARQDMAMTGELTLTGKVMPIGGLKEKVLAAYNAGLRDIILPEENRKNIEDIPEGIRENITFHCVSRAEEVLNLILRLEEEPLTDKDLQAAAHQGVDSSESAAEKSES